jgi:translation initiation factor SUI1
MEFLSSTKCDEAFDDVENYKVEIVHIWLRQRTGRKYTTEVTGLASDLNTNKIMKCWRHEFHCSVAKTYKKKDKEKKEKVIRLQGDKRDEILNFLVIENIISKDNIKVHGF